MNKVLISGRLVTDPISIVRNSKKSVFFTVAARNRYKKQDDEQYKATFIPVACFGKTAELCETHIVKGQRVEIEGHISTGKHNDKYFTSIVGDRIDFYEKAKKKDGQEDEKTSAETDLGGAVVKDADIPEELWTDIENEDDIPF